MKIKKILERTLQGVKDLGKVALYTTPFWLPGFLEAKALDLQTTKTAVTQDYLHGAYVKAGKNGNNFFVGMTSDVGRGYFLDAGISDQGIKGAVLGKNLGLEASTDLKGNKSLSLNGMISGIGLTVTGNLASDGTKTFSGTAFRAEQIGKATLYGKIDANKDNVSISGLGFYVGPTVGNTTIIPLAFASKPLTSDNYYLMAGIVGLNGKVSVSGTVGTSDFKEFSPSLKVAYKF